MDKPVVQDDTYEIEAQSYQQVIVNRYVNSRNRTIRKEAEKAVKLYGKK